MSLRFDNSQANDGKKRVAMSNTNKKSGGGFSFGKSIIFVIIAILVGAYVFLVVKDYDDGSNDKLTMSEWMEMLNEKFGRTDNRDYGDEVVSGHDIVETTFGQLNDKRLKWVLEDGDINDEALDQLAIDKKVVSKRQLNKGLTHKEGEKALNSFVEFYCNPDNYPVYEEITLNNNVEEVTQNDISDHDEDYLKCVISKENIEEGKILVLNSDGDNPIARRVVSGKTREDGTSDVTLENVENIEDVIDSLSFSGYGFLLDPDETEEDGLGRGDLGDVEIKVTRARSNESQADKPSVGAIKAYAFDFDKSSKAMDVLMKISYANDNGKSTMGNQITVNGTDLINESDEFGDKGDHDNWSASGTVEGSIELQNFTISAEGIVFEGDKNYVQVLATSDVVYDLKFDGHYEGNFKLCTIPVRIYPNPGIRLENEDLRWFEEVNIKPELYVDIDIYLVITAEGKLEIKYTIDDAAIGFKASRSAGVEPIKSNNGKSFEITGKVTVDAGLKTEADLKVNFLEWKDELIADPSVYVGAEANAEILEVNEGYEDYLPCVALDLRGPIINLTYAENSSTPLYEILDFCGVEDKKLDIFTAETAPLKKEWHVETDLDLEINMIDGGVEKCTHIKKEDLQDLINQKVDEEVDKAEDKAMDKLEQWLNNLLMEACGESCES